MAIYPYPGYLASQWQLPNGTDMVIRPIRPEDAEIEQEFIRKLSRRAKYFRFMQSISELSPQMLARFTQIDYDREMALIAVVYADGKETEIGVARYVTNPDGKSCNFAIVIADEWQRQGIAHRLMQQLIETARSRALQVMEGEVLANNHEMLNLVAKLGFSITPSPEDGSIKNVTMDL
jgi:acetyltransferase